ncbi:MAG: phosphodiester glycosidase family protein [Clostridia bacterium]|nr:phosphodiester glycosidase family protein [Clostridia bacterium]
MNEKRNAKVKRRRPGRRGLFWKVLGRIGLSILLTIVIILVLAWSLMFTVAHGPSPAMRDYLVGMAMQASATKFVPYLVLSSEDVDAILAAGAKEDSSVYSPTDMSSRVIRKIVRDEQGNVVEITVLQYGDGTAAVSGGEETGVVEYDEWKYAIDGIQFITLNRPSFKAYMLIVRDPSRVYVGTSSDYKSGLPGKRFYEMAEQEGCVALMNGGEFSDPGGQGNGANPAGLTYSRGVRVWSDADTWKTFICFDKDNKLTVREGCTAAEADALRVRDGLCFRPQKTSSSGRLIYTDDKGNVHVSTFGTSSPAQRSAIGQRADGAVIFLVTDGRSAASMGASYNDMTQLMYEYGAVTAGMLDGGSSAMLYLRDYYTTYNYDYSMLDKYQQMGLVNKYVAATTPRRIPTYWCVAPSNGGGS